MVERNKVVNSRSKDQPLSGIFPVQGRPSDLALKKFKSYWEKQILMRISNVAQVDLKAPTLIFF
jgi:hypothetical protein